MIPFTFRQLQVFVNTAHFQSLSKAAEKCFISQAAASMSLTQLERILDKTLFDRVGKRLHLNANGEHLLPLAISLLNQAEAMEDEAFSQTDAIQGRLKIGASTTIANYLLPKHMASFKQLFPRVKVELLIDNSAEIVEHVNRLDLDLGFVEGDTASHDLVCNPWMEDELLIVCNPSHPLSYKSRVSMDDLIQYRWLFREQGSGTRMMFYKAMRGDERFEVEMVLNSSEAMINYLINSDCLSYLSKVIYHNRLNRKQLVALNTEGFEVKRYFYQLQNPKKYQTKVCAAFLQYLLSTT